MEKGSIWVWVEKADGKVKQTSQEVLSQGRSMADELGGSLLAIMAGPVSEVNLEDLCGLPDQVIALEGDGEGGPSLIVETLEELIRKDPPWALLAPGTPSSMDWMPRLSVRLGVEMVSDVVAIELLEGGRLRVKRPVHGGRFLVEMESQEGGPRLLALRPRAFARKTGSRSPRVECFPMKARGFTEVQVLEKAQREKGFVDLSEARIVVSGGGRGWEDQRRSSSWKNWQQYWAVPWGPVAQLWTADGARPLSKWGKAEGAYPRISTWPSGSRARSTT
jgi:electron transfer flavoprotein alpha subunit